MTEEEKIELGLEEEHPCLQDSLNHDVYFVTDSGAYVEINRGSGIHFTKHDVVFHYVRYEKYKYTH